MTKLLRPICWLTSHDFQTGAHTRLCWRCGFFQHIEVKLVRDKIPGAEKVQSRDVYRLLLVKKLEEEVGELVWELKNIYYGIDGASRSATCYEFTDVWDVLHTLRNEFQLKYKEDKSQNKGGFRGRKALVKMAKENP